ncbi:MAG TPA: alpha/beta hydrolase [Candidatus Limnocylindrales bacterium]|nr:alpha/beta hydrolase [Candidatus Limnocylindrales bacterium]
MDSVTSFDGTTIAYDRMGDGPAVVLLPGGSVDRGSNATLAAELARDFTVFNVDRRGRGDSTDTLPYAVEREIEDITAVIVAAGGSAHLYGSSSGAALAMEAAAAGAPVAKLAMWEPPYFLDPRPELADAARVFHDLVSAGKRDEAAEYFMGTVVGMPPEFVAQARKAPWWQGQVKIAHTLEYDATVMGTYAIPEDRARSVPIATIIVDGGVSFPGMHETADRLAEVIPNAQRATLEGQQHNVDVAVLAPVLRDFFLG